MLIAMWFWCISFGVRDENMLWRYGVSTLLLAGTLEDPRLYEYLSFFLIKSLIANIGGLQSSASEVMILNLIKCHRFCWWFYNFWNKYFLLPWEFRVGLHKPLYSLFFTFSDSISCFILRKEDFGIFRICLIFWWSDVNRYNNSFRLKRYSGVYQVLFVLSNQVELDTTENKLFGFWKSFLSSSIAFSPSSILNSSLNRLRSFESSINNNRWSLSSFSNALSWTNCIPLVVSRMLQWLSVVSSSKIDH